jgi:hypothetical protein
MESIEPMKSFAPDPPPFRSFDRILERPFIETLMLALYFSRNPELENAVVEVISRYPSLELECLLRFTMQKREFCHNLARLQMLLTPDL